MNETPFNFFAKKVTLFFFLLLLLLKLKMSLPSSELLRNDQPGFNKRNKTRCTLVWNLIFVTKWWQINDLRCYWVLNVLTKRRLFNTVLWVKLFFCFVKSEDWPFLHELLYFLVYIGIQGRYSPEVGVMVEQLDDKGAEISKIANSPRKPKGIAKIKAKW